MMTPTDHCDDRMYVYTVRSLQRPVTRPIAVVIALCKQSIIS